MPARGVHAAAVAALALLAAWPARVVAAERRATPMETARAQGVRSRSPYVGALAADADTGRVLFEENADAEACPASVTKLMTLLLVLEDVEAGKLSLSERVVATPDALKYSEPSWVNFVAGGSMTVDDLLMSLMVKSANDAAIALGVRCAGSWEAFVERMNERAASLGMKRTRYYNPNGLPPVSSEKRYPWKSYNKTTCRDQLKLAMKLAKMPGVFRYTSAKLGEVTDGGGHRLSFVNHNNLMVKNKMKVRNPDGSEAVDGFKTGYVDFAGSSIVLTGKRGSKRAIVVVLGSSTSRERDAAAGRLLSDALDALDW